MPSDNNPAIGPPPLRTPFHEIPQTVPSKTLPTAEKVEQGNISRPWTGWLQQVYNFILAHSGSGGDTRLQASPLDTLDLILTTTLQDVTGAEVPLDQDGDWLVTGYFVFQSTATGAGGPCQGFLVFGGVLDDSPASLSGDSSVIATVSMSTVYNNTGSTIAKLQAKKVVDLETAHLFGYGTRIVAVYLGPH